MKKAHVQYLEARLVEMAQKAKRCVMKNVINMPSAAVASPLILAVSPGVQQAMNAMVSAMMTILVFTMVIGCLSLGLTLLLRRVGWASRGGWQGQLKDWIGEAVSCRGGGKPFGEIFGK